MLECDVICIGIRAGRLQRVHLRLRSNRFRQDLHHGGYVTVTARAYEDAFWYILCSFLNICACTSGCTIVIDATVAS